MTTSDTPIIFSPITKQDINALLNQAVVKLTGASSNALKAELFDVLDEFFDISSSWQETIYFDTDGQTDTYFITPSQGRFVRLLSVQGNSNFSTSSAFLAAATNATQQSGWLRQTAVFQDMDNGQLTLLNPPNTAQAMRAMTAKSVTRPTSEDMVPIAPAWVLGRYHRYILDGLLGKFMGTPNKSYTNAQGADYHMHRFQEGISRARTDAAAQNTMGGTAWVFPGTYRTRSQRGYLSVGSSRGF